MSQQRVAIAVDGSDPSDSALNFYLEHLSRVGHELLLLHCVEAMASIGEVADEASYERVMDDGKKRADALEEEYTRRMQERNVECRFVRLYSHRPGEAVVGAAEAEGATLLVTGTRGLNTTRRTVLGSVSDYILHHAPCPVILCRKR